jgi:hypothetical protein
MNVEIRTLAAQILLWENLFRIFGIDSLQCGIRRCRDNVSPSNVPRTQVQIQIQIQIIILLFIAIQAIASNAHYISFVTQIYTQLACDLRKVQEIGRKGWTAGYRVGETLYFHTFLDVSPLDGQYFLIRGLQIDVVYLG